MQSNPARRFIRCCVLSIVILLDCRQGFTQSPPLQQSFPTQDNPKIVISNASTVLIAPWDKKEVSITIEAAGSVIQPQEVIIKSESNKLDISCRPEKRDRRISLILRVPAKTVLEMKSYGNEVELKEPTRPITIQAGKEYIYL